MPKQATCAERIEDHLKGRLEDMAVIVKAEQDADGEYSEDNREEYEQGILSIDKISRYDVCLSTGGPADGFRLDFQDGEIIRAEYYFQDWYDGATRTLEGDKFRAVADMFTPLIECFECL